jgi:alpha-tubulin suppressor-like RCC1 family protein
MGSFGNQPDAAILTDLPLPAPAIDVSTYRHTCVVLEGGGVRCWGNGEGGKLGYGDEIQTNAPPDSDVDLGGAAAERVFVAEKNTCALLVGGSLRCWGDGSTAALGHGGDFNVGDGVGDGMGLGALPNSSMLDVDLGQPVVDVATGWMFTCAVLQDETANCWGYHNLGRLGYGADIDCADNDPPSCRAYEPMPNALPIGSEPILSIESGFRHSCAVVETATGTRARCWGYGWEGALGYGDTDNIGEYEYPIDEAVWGDVPTGGQVVQMSTGYNHSCALMVTGSVRCWGRGENGRLGYGNVDAIGKDALHLPSDAGDVPLF